MGTDDFSYKNEIAPGPINNPWPAVCTGPIASAAALVWFWSLGYETGWVLGVGLSLLLIGLLAAGIGIAIRPQSPIVLALGSIAGWLAFGSMDPVRWDSARLLVGVLSGVACFAAVLMLLPRVVRRTVFSLVILFHFGGIVTATMTVAPSPWLSTYLWAWIYRPYLEFMYLNNAYHFYSPEPGPGDLVWFYVKYEDGSAQWFKIPNRDDNPVAQEYQRRLSLVQSVNQLFPVGPIPAEIGQRRLEAWKHDGIPPHPDLPDPMQYRPPNLYSRIMLETYARHVAHTVVHPNDPQMKVKGIKIYRLIHRIIDPREINEGVEPTARWLYYPYYQGEYDSQGNLLDPKDPYLYWLIPIIKGKVSKGPFRPGRRLEVEGDDSQIADYLELHVKLPTNRLFRDEPSLPGAE